MNDRGGAVRSREGDVTAKPINGDNGLSQYITVRTGQEQKGWVGSGVRRTLLFQSIHCLGSSGRRRRLRPASGVRSIDGCAGVTKFVGSVRGPSKEFRVDCVR